jgi:hypothetical protein
MRDVSPADWIMERLRPWDPTGVRLHSFAPDGFNAYARIFHPARASDPSGEIRWGALGAARGVPLTPDVSFSEVSGLDPGDLHELDELAPRDGELPRATCEVLARVLRPHTQTPTPCWFCLWEGNGAFWSRAHTPTYADEASGPDLDRYWADAGAQDALLGSTPKVEAAHRSYLLFRGRLDAACGFEPAGWHVAPNLWWPDDRSWLVATEVDGYSTYVGASGPAIDDVLASSALEAISVAHDVHMDPGPHRPRWR